MGSFSSGALVIQTSYKIRLAASRKSLLASVAADWAAADELCALNGISSNGTCKCYPGWRGDDCGVLDLLPVEKPLSPAYGKMPTVDQQGLASWGASVIQDPDGKTWHMYVAEMALQCGLTGWYRNSIIVHATAPNAFGPYTRKDEILTYFAHEPVIVPLPKSQGGGYLLYKIGCGDGAVTGSNGTLPPGGKKMVGPCTGCHNGRGEANGSCGCGCRG